MRSQGQNWRDYHLIQPATLQFRALLWVILTAANVEGEAWMYPNFSHLFSEQAKPSPPLPTHPPALLLAHPPSPLISHAID